MPAWTRSGAQFARQADELADDLAGDDPPGEGYLAKAGRLTAARRQAEEIISHEYGPLTSDDEDDGDEDDEPAQTWATAGGRGRDHPSWPEVDAEQQERIHGPATD